MKLVTLIFCFAIFGCTTAEEIQGPDGTANQLIRCSDGIKACYEKASEVCGGKYKIVNSSSDTSGLGGAYPTSTTNELLVKCEGQSFR